MKNNIVLIGMPGVGKSTVGVILAKRLRLSFLDTDILIQTKEGKSLQEIIQKNHIQGFRKIEEAYLLSVTKQSHVIATGGSVVYSEKAMKHLATHGHIIHLDISLKLLSKRLDDIDARGVLRMPGQSLTDIFNDRQPLYLKYADRTVNTDGITPEQVISKIMAISGLVQKR